jgi:type II secretory pathway pseudopilin PulG
MEFAQTLQQHCREYFIKCATVAALIFVFTSAGVTQTTKAEQPAVPWAQYLKDNPALLAEFGQLVEKLRHDIQLPPERSRSRLLPLLPESTIVYAAFPNYGDASHQALTIFEQEVKDSLALRTWWQHGEMATNGPKLEDSLEKIYQFSQYLGDEIVVAGANEGRKDPGLLILAEVRKPGLENLLRQLAKEAADESKESIRILSVQDLAAAKDTGTAQGLVILVRPDLVVGALDVATLRSFNAQVDRNVREFATTAFGQRLAQVYDGGITATAGFDFQKILGQLPAGNDQNKVMLQRSGFADAKYLIWQHKSGTGQAASQTELSFTGPRHGVASWLAAPGPMGSLDFVSPKAVLAGAVLLKDPALIFEDIKGLATASNPNALASLAQMEQLMRLSLKDDLLGHLGGEITLEVDSFKQPTPVWKAILRVNDPDRLQATFATLLALAHVTAPQSEDGGVTYRSLRIPSTQQKTIEISYAFDDGYLIIASSHEAVAEAIRLHKTGESLAKSRKFLASLPAGPSSEVSALLYEDPMAMAAISLQQALPGLAESFSQKTAEPEPTMIFGYGEESAIRETSRSGAVDAGAVMVMAAIAIPNLLRARTAANESAAVGTIRLVNTAQIAYSSTYTKGFARDLAILGPDPSGTNVRSAAHAGMIDTTLGNASCTSGVWCTKSGFQFSIKATCGQYRCTDFVVVGTPVSSNTGTRSFCSTRDAVIRFKLGPPLTSPITALECRGWLPLR